MLNKELSIPVVIEESDLVVLRLSYKIMLAIIYGLYSDTLLRWAQHKGLLGDHQNNPYSIPGIVLQFSIKSLPVWPIALTINSTQSAKSYFFKELKERAHDNNEHESYLNGETFLIALKNIAYGLFENIAIYGCSFMVPMSTQVYVFTTQFLNKYYSPDKNMGISFFSRIKQGMRWGFQKAVNSIPGAAYLNYHNTQSENAWQEYLFITEQRWSKHLDKLKEQRTIDDEILPNIFEEWMERGITKYLINNPDISPLDIVRVSYDDLKTITLLKLI